MELRDYAEKALKWSLKEAEQAEAYTSIRKEKRILIDNNKLSYIESKSQSRITLMTIKEKKIGVSSLSSLNNETIQRAINYAITIMKNSPPDTDFETLISPVKLTSVGEYYDKTIIELDDKDFIQLAKNSVDIVNELKATITQGELRIVTIESCLLNSEGVDVQGTKTYIFYDFTIMVSNGAKSAEGFISRGYSFLNDIEIEQHLEKVISLTRKCLCPQKIEGGLFDVVLDKDAAYDILSILGYALNGDNARKMRSPFTGKLNTKVLSSKLSIIDDGTLSRGYSTYISDGEGFTMKRKIVIDKGVLKTYLLDSYTARKFNTESTGNAGRGRPFPSIRITNLIVEGGTKETEDLISEIDKGLYIPRLPPLMPNPMSGEFSVELRQAFLIRNGELKEAVRWGMLSDNIYGMLNRVIEVSKDREKIYSLIVPSISVSKVKIEA